MSGGEDLEGGDVEGGGETPFKTIPAFTSHTAEEVSNAIRDDSNAKAESVFLERGKTEAELAEEAMQAEHDRNQKFRNHFERMAIISLWGMFIALGVVSIVWIWHQISPAKIPIWTWAVIHCHWLSESQLSTLQNIITGGVIAASLGKHFEKRLGQ